MQSRVPRCRSRCRPSSWQHLLALVLCLLLAACGGDKPTGAGSDAGGGEGATASTTAEAAESWPRAPRFDLFDGAGRAWTEADLAGQVWLAVFLDGRLPDAELGRIAGLVELVQGTTRPGKDGRAQVFFCLEPGEGVDPEKLRKEVSSTVASLQGARVVGAPGDQVRVLRENGFEWPDWWSRQRADGAVYGTQDAYLVDRYGRMRERADPGTDAGRATLAQALQTTLGERPARKMAFPPDSLEPTWLEERAQAQRKAAGSWTVRKDFRFEDRRLASGIHFVHRCVDDSGRDYKPVHYDHGSGVAIADVDGDGRHDLYFCNQVGSNQLWRNLGGGRFEDITARAGVAVREPCGVTASFADTDNDGDPDLFVTSVRGGNFLFRNDGTGRFEDVTKTAGLGYVGHSSAGVFFDYDRDGLLDLYLCNVGVYTTDLVRTVLDDTTTSGQEPGPFEFYDGLPDAFSGHLKADRLERSILYHNLGGNRFEDVTEAMGIGDDAWTGDASPVDMNEDGWIDLYVLNMQGHDEYYENVKGEKFVRRSRAVFPRTPWGSMGVKVFDFDQDQKLDIYITDMHSDMSQRIGPEDEKRKSEMVWPESLVRSGGQSIWGNAFYHRMGPDTVEEVSDGIGAENYWPWGLSVGDLNADGYEDAFLTSSMNFFYRYGVNSLLLNDAGRRFLDAEFVLGVEPRRGALFVPWFDLDCMNGRDMGHPLCKTTGMGIVTAWGPLGSRSSVIFDLDDDGDLDIVTNDMNSEPLVLFSDLAEKGGLHYLKVKLVGSVSNRDGLGALVRVRAGGRDRLMVHDGQSGYLSQSSQWLYFGLGESSSVEQVQVTWPSGTEQVVKGPLKANQVLEIVEPR
jgi:hypothetical protein